MFIENYQIYSGSMQNCDQNSYVLSLGQFSALTLPNFYLVSVSIGVYL